MKHKTGYYVRVYGLKYWHRTIEGARKRAIDAQAWCHNVHITDVSTDELISGRPE